MLPQEAHSLQNELQSQLTIARNEINKLRQQVRTLQHVQRKDVAEVMRALKDFRCEGCRQQRDEAAPTQDDANSLEKGEGAPFRPIGVIRTVFPEKRAVPRQSTVGGRLRGMVELNADTFTNPAHALEGLEDYSHLWLIYHFHRNGAHPKAKVAPPRLGGQRVGVFCTRSPHRPCPIGLSLVEIDQIKGHCITFYGTDMVDGTPVLDLKPYIPCYDAPCANVDSGRVSAGLGDTVDFYNSRQEPDGEESELEKLAAAAAGGATTSNCAAKEASMAGSGGVKVPSWVLGTHRLTVCFNEHAEAQLNELDVERASIVDILETDPRSVYLRTKYGSQIFTFQLGEVTVTCKFDDRAGRVTVVQIRRTENVQDEEIRPQEELDK